jgi:hypothetical protein
MPAWNYKRDEDGNITPQQVGLHKIIDDNVLLGIDPAGGGANLV